MNKAKFVTELKGKESTQKSPPPLNICIVINVLYYLKPFSKVITLSEPLDNIGSDIERTSFLALKQILTQLESGTNDPINIYPFLDKFCLVTNTNLHEFECLDVSFIWDSVIKVVTVVIPPLREVFLGRISSSLDIPSWLNLISRCFHAQFLHPAQTLEEVLRATLLNYVHDDEEDEDDDADDDSELYDQKSPAERIRGFNAKILYRAPEILVFAVESTHLPLTLRFTDMFTRANGKAKPPAAIRFPASFDMSVFLNENEANCRAALAEGEAPLEGDEFSPAPPRWYDLTSVVTLEGTAYDSVQAYYRSLDTEDSQQWMEGSGAHHEEVDRTKVVEGSYFNISDTKKVHPRLLIYTKRGMFEVLDRLGGYVTKAGQMRSLGDATFESAETPEHYDEAKHYYEEAITYDPALRPLLQERLTALELIERNQRAHCYETQADISLGRRRFKEACDLYKSAMRSAVVNSPLYMRIREKEDYMMKIISLEIANHLTEKGQECLKAGSFAQGKEHFLQAMKLNPSYLHLQTIIAGIDQAITVQSSAQKVAEANQAMKLGKYRQANQLFQESIALIPEREAALKAVLESLVGLMQGEEALIKQRAGLVALEDKKYILAIDFITEAIALLPAESVMEHAFFLCDRAQVYFEMKEFVISIDDCMAALALRPDLAMGYLRLGAAQFELERYDEAIDSYERAIRNDATLSDQVKVKMRQVNTAKEILQRKEREAERARIKEEEKRMLEERRARDEAAKKSRQQKLDQEKAEKVERGLMREEELRTIKVNAASSSGATSEIVTSEQADAKAADKSSKDAKGKKDKDAKTEKDLQKAAERERVRQEKEKERERVKAAKEQKILDEKRAKEEEIQRERDFAAELERAANRVKENEREKELEREKARIERERVIAEREKAREEKLADSKKAKPASKTAAPAAPAAAASGAEIFPAIFAGGVKVTVKGNKGATPLVVPAPSVEPPAVASTPVSTPSTPQPGAKWSSILTPAPTPPPAPASTSFKNQYTNPYSGSNNNRNRGNSTPDIANDFPPLGDAAEGDSKKGGGFQSEVGFQYNASSAWADHERAMLEATAERISVRDTPTTSTKSQAPAPLTTAPAAATGSSSSSSSEQKRSDNSASVAGGEQAPGGKLTILKNPAHAARNDPAVPPREVPPLPELSPLLSKLGIGGGGNAGGSAAPSGGLIQRTHMPSENDDHDINLLLSSSLEPIPASPVDFSLGSIGGPRAAEPSPSLNSLLGGGFDQSFGAGFGGNDSNGAFSLNSLLSDSSLLGGNGGGAFGSLYPSSGSSSLLAGDSLFGNSASARGSSNDLLGLLGGSNPSNNSFGLGGMGGGGSGLNLDSSYLGGAPDLRRGSSSGFGLDVDIDSLGGFGSPDPLLGGNSFSSLLGSGGYSSNQGGMGNDFGSPNGFGFDNNPHGNNGFGLGQQNALHGGASDALNFGLGGAVPMSRHSSNSPFMHSPGPLAGLLHPPTPPLLNLAPQSNPHFSSLLDLNDRPNHANNNIGGGGGGMFGIADNNAASKGIDSDVVPENYFPSVTWLRGYDMHMYRWAGNAQEWTEFAMHIPRDMFPAVYGEDGGLNAAVSEVSRRSGCKMWKETEFLRGVSESFLCFQKGSEGQPSHQAMLAALELLSTLLMQWISAAQSRSATPVNSFLGAVVQPASNTPSASRIVGLSSAAAPASSAASAAATAAASSAATAAALAAAVANGTAVVDETGAIIMKRDRPPLLKVAALQASGYLQRYLEIPREVVGLIIGQGGKKIKELCTESGAKIQFRVNKTAEREGRPGLLEVHGSQDNVDKALQQIWDLLQLLGKEYNEVPHNTNITKSAK